MRPDSLAFQNVLESSVGFLFFIFLHQLHYALQKIYTIWQSKYVDKEKRQPFDVTMGSHGGAEICELVGQYLLHELNKTIKHQHLGL